jgi:hypothetical protein
MKFGTAARRLESFNNQKIQPGTGHSLTVGFIIKASCKSRSKKPNYISA